MRGIIISFKSGFCFYYAGIAIITEALIDEDMKVVGSNKPAGQKRVRGEKTKGMRTVTTNLFIQNQNSPEE